MTERAEKVIKDALGLIVAQMAEAPLEAADASLAIRFLNRMMAKFRAKGIDVGYTPINSIDDFITVKDEAAIDGIVPNLALKLAPVYSNSEVSQTLRLEARDGRDTLIDVGFTIGAMDYPDTLPRGSGNKALSSMGDAFYDDLDTYGTLRLQGNTIETTIAAAGAPVLIAGAWALKEAASITGSSAGRMTYKGTGTRLNFFASVTMEPAAGSNKTLTIHLFRNGLTSNLKASKRISNGTPSVVSLSGSIQVENGDYLELYGSNDTDAENLTAIDAVFKVD